MLILFSGNIACGKSTLSQLTSRELGIEIMPEPIDYNPFLDLFYSDKKKWGFITQLYFLNNRFQCIKQALSSDSDYILDRSIYEDIVFAENGFEEGNMSEEEFEKYKELYQNILSEINRGRKRKMLLIHLHGSHDEIMRRLKKRGREYEKSEEMYDYLKRLNKKYEAWVEAFDVCDILRIDIDQYDITYPEHEKAIVEMIRTKIDAVRNSQ